MKIPTAGVILAAAGEGRRLGSKLPKALVPLAGTPLFLHALRTFAALSFVHEIAVVLPPDWVDRIRTRLGRRLETLKVTTLVPGGARRQDSVKIGLDALRAPIVLVHDAARPLISKKAITDVTLAAARHGAAVLAHPAVDTIKIADRRGRVVSTPDRAQVWHAQTPQGFRRRVLLNAYKVNGRQDATDDVQLVERAGGKVVIVPGPATNFKVTTPDDLVRAGGLLDSPRG
ncbi:MAG: 2-C-methyl-D-erythritol 4-phosphate cytidylyltransferase [Planctomycetaceae bacterium]|nr:2-C-methyl-D-erythritol 4-phosphate cytidylyltransferase [Planctomycetaceae bacterium]